MKHSIFKENLDNKNGSQCPDLPCRTENHGAVFDKIIGESDALRNAVILARRIAESDTSSILLQGETGTGKDLFARAIHDASRRNHQPFVTVNCAAIPATLIESELFGYEKGAFTDAKERKEGLFEQAQGGTIFLDEIGELELNLQAKLLRVLEAGEFRRVGGLRDLPLDARVIGASNRNLSDEVKNGAFRLDLYYRLAVVEIKIPPLRERGNDVILLANHYIQQFNRQRNGNMIEGLSPEVAAIFAVSDWSGNVRELKNVIERSLIFEEGNLITPRCLPDSLLASASKINSETASLFKIPAEGFSLDELEEQITRQAMQRTHGNITKAAKLLNISRDRMRSRVNTLE